MKTVLITGSSGFLGARVCNEFASAGYDVRTFDVSDGQDILNLDQITTAITGCDICVHLAAVSDLYEAELSPDVCFSVNVDGTKNISKACFDNNVRLLYASTCCAYGNNGVAVSDESSPLVPTELYAKTKLMGEKVIEQSGCNYRLLRLATFYGPEMRKSLATSVFLEKTIAGVDIEIHGDGKQTRCYTHVDDIALGIRIVADNKECPKIINISDNTPYSVNELVAIVSSIVGRRSKAVYVKDRIGQITSSSINSDLLKSLGWMPVWTLYKGLSDCFNKLSSKS